MDHTYTKILEAATLVAFKTRGYMDDADNHPIILKLVSDTSIAILRMQVTRAYTCGDLCAAVARASQEPDNRDAPSLTLLFTSSITTIPQRVARCVQFSPQTTELFRFTDTQPDTITAGHVFSALSALRCADETPLSALQLVSTTEKEMLLAWANAAPEDRSDDRFYSPLIHQHFQRVAARTPNLIALEIYNGTAISYGELDTKSDRVAAFLTHTLGVRKGDMVLEYFDKSIEMIIGMLGIFKAGAVHVPIDIEHPAERVRVICNITQSRMCLTTTMLCAEAELKLGADDTIAVWNLDEVMHVDLNATTSALPDDITGDDLCYVLFTSGSTGTPKGVAVQHSAVVACIIDGPAVTQQLRQRNSNLRALFFANYAFDMSIYTIFNTLTSGGCLCIVPKLIMLNDLEGAMNHMRITLLIATPTVLSLINPARVPTLTHVISGGEALTVGIRRRYQNVPGRQIPILLMNGGGPTETTIISVYSVPSATDHPNLYGRPFGGNQLYVLDADRGLAPTGTVGELWIGGPQVAKGYLGRSDLTAKVFKPNRFGDGGMMYNTGDLCSWTPDGNLLYWGRSDMQVKIRGQRVEIGDVESALLTLEDVKVVGVVKQRELVAFVELVPGASNDVLQRLKQLIAQKLPKYMVPTAILRVDAMPLTLSGKADRKALEQILDAERARLVSILDTSSNDNSLISKIMSTWSSVLAVPISTDSDFFGIGGDSISAIRLATAFRAAGIPLSVSDLLEHPTPRALSALLENRNSLGEGTPAGRYRPFSLLEPEASIAVLAEVYAYDYREGDVEDAYPCTPFVGGLISLAVSNPFSYFAQYTFEKDEQLDPHRLRTAWQAVWRRHDILRTIFISAPPPFRDMIQVVLAPEAVDMRWSLRTFDGAEEQQEAVVSHLKSSSGFALGQIPTCVAIFRSPSSTTTVLQLHHSQYDGWSLPIVLKDVEVAYNTFTPHPAPPPYSSFVQWVQDQDRTAALAFWRNELADVQPTLWPLTNSLDVRRVTERSLSVCWSNTGLELFCKESRVTMSSVIRTALAVTLGRHAHAEDVVFGVVTSGRTGDLDGVESVVGPCISTVPCRVRLPQDSPLESILQTVHKNSMRSIPFQSVGLVDILRNLGSASSDLFNVLLTIENLPGVHEIEDHFLGCNTSGHWLSLTYPLCIAVFPSKDGAALRFDLQWDSGCLSDADVKWFHGHLFSVLDTLLRAPSTPLRDVDLITEEEKIFVRSAGTGSPKPPSFGFFHHIVDAAVERFASRIALEYMNGQNLTYEELVKTANQVAHGLQCRGVRSEMLVPILFDKNKNQIPVVVAMLAVSKAGGAFVPLDVSWPVERLKACIAQTHSHFVVVSEMSELGKQLNVVVVSVDRLGSEQATSAPPTPSLQPTSLSYCLFTSGSTGVPKGVLIQHDNVVAFMENAVNGLPWLNVRRILHFCPWTFDMGLSDMWLALTCGATVVLADMDDMLTDLSNTLNASCADYLCTTPAIAQLIDPDIEYPYLKSLVVGGEKLPTQLRDRWRGRVDFVDAYGPTEGTVVCISASHTAEYIPPSGVIGRPFGSMRAYIVDESLRTCPIGVVGELCIAGTQVGRGYLDLAEKTASVFVPDVFFSTVPGERMYRTGDLALWTSDGQIKYLGRQQDGLVKLRGLRIDLAEIESALNGVRGTVAVVELVESGGQQHLLAFVSRTSSAMAQGNLALVSDPRECRPWIADLLASCRRMLPSYAVPSLWVALEAIPQGNSNKLDRKALSRLYHDLCKTPSKIVELTRVLVQAHDEHVQPQSTTEIMLYDLYTSLLERKNMSVQDDLQSVGVDSITNTRVLAALRREGYDVSVRELYGASTIAAVAEIIDAKSSSVFIASGSLDAGGLVIQIQPAAPGWKNASSLWFMHDGKGIIGPEYGHWDSLGPRVLGIANPATDAKTLETKYGTWQCIVAQYLPLLPSEGVFLGGWSSGGNLALAMAAERIARGLPVDGVILLDPFNSEDLPVHDNHTYYPAKKGRYISKPKARQLVHLKHTRLLLQTFRQPTMLDVPVLLIRAGTGIAHTLRHFVIPPTAELGQPSSRYETNFFGRDKLAKLQVVTIDEADHKSLMQNVALSGRVAEVIRQFVAECAS